MALTGELGYTIADKKLKVDPASGDPAAPMKRPRPWSMPLRPILSGLVRSLKRWAASAASTAPGATYRRRNIR